MPNRSESQVWYIYGTPEVLLTALEKPGNLKVAEYEKIVCSPAALLALKNLLAFTDYADVFINDNRGRLILNASHTYILIEVNPNLGEKQYDIHWHLRPVGDSFVLGQKSPEFQKEKTMQIGSYTVKVENRNTAKVGCQSVTREQIQDVLRAMDEHKDFIVSRGGGRIFENFGAFGDYDYLSFRLQHPSGGVVAAHLRDSETNTLLQHTLLQHGVSFNTDYSEYSLNREQVTQLYEFFGKALGLTPTSAGQCNTPIKGYGK